MSRGLYCPFSVPGCHCPPSMPAPTLAAACMGGRSCLLSAVYLSPRCLAAWIRTLHLAMSALICLCIPQAQVQQGALEGQSQWRAGSQGACHWVTGDESTTWEHMLICLIISWVKVLLQSRQGEEQASGGGYFFFVSPEKSLTQLGTSSLCRQREKCSHQRNSGCRATRTQDAPELSRAA